MGWIHLFLAFYVVSSSNFINVFFFVMYPFGRNWHPRFKLLSVNMIIFGEVHVDKVGNCMSITGIPYITFFIMVSINHLLVKPGRFIIVWIKLLSRLLFFFKLASNSMVLFSIKFIDIIKILLVLFFFVLKFKFMNFISVSFLKFMILFHNTIHIFIIDVNIDNLLSLL